MVVFNASLHYWLDLGQTLGEALRVLRPGDHIVVVDSPFYSTAEPGERMLRERDEQFARDFGFGAPARAAASFLTPERLTTLAELWSLPWSAIWPTPWWRRFGHRQVGRLQLGREPASFPILVGEQASLATLGVIVDTARLGLRLPYRLRTGEPQ